jgi:hypothetical protein
MPLPTVQPNYLRRINVWGNFVGISGLSGSWVAHFYSGVAALNMGASPDLGSFALNATYQADGQGGYFVTLLPTADIPVPAGSAFMSIFCAIDSAFWSTNQTIDANSFNSTDITVNSFAPPVPLSTYPTLPVGVSQAIRYEGY